MDDERREPIREPIKVKVMDKRRTGQGTATGERPKAVPDPEGVDEESEMQAEQARDFLDDLRRLQAEFDNYRKRVLREQTAMASRASARLIERLLPVLDNFERAIEHGEAGAGIELIIKDFRATLEAEGLEVIEAEGEPFDPRIHEAFQAVDDPDVGEPVVRAVYRRGYRLGDAVLRPPMVVVARPVERADDTDAEPATAADAGEPESGDRGGKR